MFNLVYRTLGILTAYSHIVFSNPIAYDQRQTGEVNVQIHLKDVKVVALLDSGLLEDYVDYDYAYDYADFTLKPSVKPTTSSPSVSSSTVKPWDTWPTKPASSTTTEISSDDKENSQLNSTKKPEETTISVSSEKTTVSAPEEERTTVSPSEEKTTISLSEEKTSTLSSEEKSTISSPNEQESIEDVQTGNSKLNKSDETTVNLRINIKNDNELMIAEQDADEKISATTNEPQKKSCPVQYIPDRKGRCRSIKNRRRVSLVPLAVRLGSRLTEKGNFSLRKDLPIRVYKSEPNQ
ncbi:cell wall protein RBR3-like [Venturia canescens]|uniref:cell wall protein RBR3-like n=1 Tax=Venturia canescens TaxID=32260 RepID=UPI001C9C6F5A|nr:cell wall protein RBR3-like [Venturia canescens]